MDRKRKKTRSKTAFHELLHADSVHFDEGVSIFKKAIK